MRSVGILTDIEADLVAIETARNLEEPERFEARMEALDEIEFGIVNRIEPLLRAPDPSDELVALQQRVEHVRERLESVNRDLFGRIRTAIRSGACVGPALKATMHRYAGSLAGDRVTKSEVGYDYLDAFVSGILLRSHPRASTDSTHALEPEMVAYQPTPARVVLELIERARFTKDDVFWDLGSGLGQVTILANLVGRTRAKGVEFDPAHCAHSRQCAADLNLSGIEFINADARFVDYSEGTVFYLYTPFAGTMLQTVLEALRAVARDHSIRVFTYGPCTFEVAKQEWLTPADEGDSSAYRLGGFTSR